MHPERPTSTTPAAATNMPSRAKSQHGPKTKGWFDEIEESWIYGVELKPDFSGVIGEPVALLCPPQTMDDPQAEWENRSVTTHEVNRRWTEGSYMVKHGNLYYMLYSANFFGGKNYAVGYATSQNPLGPIHKSCQQSGAAKGYRARRHRDRNRALYAHRYSQPPLLCLSWTHRNHW